ncbi:MAG: transglutaminase-like domain-containing protein [Candidatus Nanopelagicales bacterium]
MSMTRSHARPRLETAPARPAGQRWGLGVVAALPALLVALAMPLIVEGSLTGFVYAPLVIAVMAITIALGRWPGLGVTVVGIFIGILVGPGGYAPESVVVSTLLSAAILGGTWIGQVLVLGPRPASAALPALSLLAGALAAGMTGTIEAGVLTAFTGLALALLLILLGPWNGDGAVRPARWAEVLTVLTITVAALATYAISVSAPHQIPRTIDLFGRAAQESRTDGGVPDPFLIAARWQLDPAESGRALFTISTGPDAPLNRPTWATFSTYNGIAWISPPTYGVPGDDIPPEEVGAPADSYVASTRVTVGVGLPGQWVPVPQRVSQVLSPVATRADPATGVVASVSSPIDYSFDIRYSLAVADREEVRAAEPALSSDLDPAVAIPGPLTGTMAALSDLVLAEEDGTWQRLVRLSEELRDPRYSAAPPQALAAGPPDRSYSGLNQVLAEGVGFQEQYAAIWAIIARSWGVPTRLVIGFPPGEEADAPGVRTVLASQVSVWAEARLEGLGWVAFQGSPQDVAAGRPAVVRPLTPEEVPSRPEPQPGPTGGDASGGDGADGGGSADQGGEAEQSPSIPWPLIVPVIVAVLAFAWVAYVALRRRTVRQRLRSSEDPRADVAGAWRWTRLLLAESWLALPLSYAPAPDADYPPDLPDDVQWHVVTLARLAGPALYGPGPVEPAVADEAWRVSTQVDRAIRKVTGWRGALRRLITPIDPERTTAPGLARTHR